MSQELVVLNRTTLVIIEPKLHMSLQTVYLLSLQANLKIPYPYQSCPSLGRNRKPGTRNTQIFSNLLAEFISQFDENVYIHQNIYRPCTLCWIVLLVQSARPEILCAHGLSTFYHAYFAIIRRLPPTVFNMFSLYIIHHQTQPLKHLKLLKLPCFLLKYWDQQHLK